MKRWRVQWGYREGGIWHNDVAGCSYTVEARNEREARKLVRELLKARNIRRNKNRLRLRGAPWPANLNGIARHGGARLTRKKPHTCAPAIPAPSSVLHPGLYIGASMEGGLSAH